MGNWQKGAEGFVPRNRLPAAIVVLPEIPLNSNGKLDRKALPMPKPDEYRKSNAPGFIAPDTSTEKALADIWSELLQLDTLSVNSDFIELGGESVIIMQCLNRVQTHFHVDLPLEVFFTGECNVRGIAALIDQLRAE